MSDTERLAGQARSELALTEAAFDAMREEYIEAAIGAADQQGVMAAVAAARLVDEVRQRLRSHIDTHAIAQGEQPQE